MHPFPGVGEPIVRAVYTVVSMLAKGTSITMTISASIGGKSQSTPMALIALGP